MPLTPEATTFCLFAFEGPVGESRSNLLRRVCDRLARVCDYARHRDVTVVLETSSSAWDRATADANRVTAATFRALVPSIFVAGMYFVICYGISQMISLIERRTARSGQV